MEKKKVDLWHKVEKKKKVRRKKERKKKEWHSEKKDNPVKTWQLIHCLFYAIHRKCQILQIVTTCTSASQTQCSAAKWDVLYFSVSSKAVKISLQPPRLNPLVSQLLKV